MKKFIAIFFLLLICLTSMSGKMNLCNVGYELVSDSEDAELESKDGKKEIKEFTLHMHKRVNGTHSFSNSYMIHEAFISPHPVIDKHTPPPNQVS